MGDFFGFEQKAAFFQIGDDQRIGLFDEHAGEGLDFFNKFAFFVDGQQKRQIIFFAEL